MAGSDHGHSHDDHDDHSSDHDHSHDHSETEDTIRRKGVLKRLYQAAFLCTCFIIVEVIGGLMAHSLAILSDAAHLFADLASFAVAIAASYLASMPTTRLHTFGLKRTESLAALFSMVTLALVSIGLGYEAVHRLVKPPEELVEGKVMTGIASIGVCVNIALAFVLGEDHVHMPGAHSHDHENHDDGHDHSHGHGHGVSEQSSGGYELLPTYQKPNGDLSHRHGHNHGDEENGHSHGNHEHSNCANHDDNDHDHDDHDHDHGNGSPDDDHNHTEEDKRNINLRAAYLHVLADLAQSVAVLIGGLVIWFRPEWHIIDPILTLLFAMLVLYSTFGVLRSSVSVLLEETPSNISWRQVHEAMSQVPNVKDIHDLHIWSISHGQPTLSVHCQSSDPDALRKIRDQCLKFGISHATIQVQRAEGPCLTCGDAAYCTRHLAD